MLNGKGEELMQGYVMEDYLGTVVDDPLIQGLEQIQRKRS